MRLTSPKTFEVLKWTLKLPTLSQRLIYKNSNKFGDGVSLGQVNHVFQWLEGMGFIDRVKVVRRQRGVKDELSSGRYQMANPTGLLRAISFFRSMDRNLVAKYDLDLKKEELLEYLDGQNITYCLDTALERHDTYIRSDRVCFYATDMNMADDINGELSSVRQGLTRCEVFLWDFKGLDIRKPINSEDGYTTPIQTIIDLFCNDRAYYTKELIRNQWGVAL